MWKQRATLNPSQAKVYDLAGGITNQFGDILTYGQIKFLQVHAAGDNGGTISVGGAGNAFSDFLGGTNQSVKLRPGADFFLMIPGTNAYLVGAGVTDELYLVNDSAVATATNSADIFVGGIGQ